MDGKDRRVMLLRLRYIVLCSPSRKVSPFFSVGTQRICARTGYINVKLMWANSQCDGRPVEYGWRPLFNAIKFG